MPDQPSQQIMQAAADRAAQIDLASRTRALEMVNTTEGIDLATERLCTALELAASSNPLIASTAASYLAHRRHSAPAAAASRPAPRRTCGPADDLGYCRSPHHDMDCSGVARTAMQEALEADRGPDADAAWARADEERQRMSERATAEAADDNGRTWLDQFGEPLTLTGLLEQSSGVRLTRDTPFQTGYGQREMLRAQRRIVLHNQDDGLDHPGMEIDRGAEIDRLRQQFDPRRETPQELAGRRAASMHRQPVQARWWGDAQ